MTIPTRPSIKTFHQHMQDALHRIRKAPRKVSKKVIDKMRDIVRKMEEDPNLKDEVNKQYDYNEWSSSRERFTNTRPYTLYNRLFEPALGKNIEEMLVELAQKRGKPLQILDDGAGQGIFLHEIKERLGKRGIRCKTTGTLLHEGYSEDYKKNMDAFHIGPSEAFVPETRQDAIFSLFGVIYYAHKSFKKDLILKTAYHLKPGGFACIGFTLSGKLQEKRGQASLIRELKQDGFEVIFHVHERTDDPLPSDVLIIKRPLQRRK